MYAHLTNSNNCSSQRGRWLHLQPMGVAFVCQIYLSHCANRTRVAWISKARISPQTPTHHKPQVLAGATQTPKFRRHARGRMPDSMFITINDFWELTQTCLGGALIIITKGKLTFKCALTWVPHELKSALYGRVHSLDLQSPFRSLLKVLKRPDKAFKRPLKTFEWPFKGL